MARTRSVGAASGRGRGTTTTIAVALALATVLGAVAAAAPAEQPGTARPKKSDPSERLFDPSFIHEVAIDVAPGDMGPLEAQSEERVPATVTVDGVGRDTSGLRLKLGYASFRPLDRKSGFSVKMNEFVKGQDVFGVERFTLGNAVTDPTFISEHLTYEVFRRAGIPAPRTALANVTFNGEYFGLHVLREAYDKEFLKRHFANAKGNLYEADVAGGVDLSDPRISMRSNEDTNDLSDVKALERIVATVPDDQYVKALGKVVDLPELFTYWAAEVLTAHWDGYLAGTNVPFGNTDPAIVQGNTVPNNFYAYRDPTRWKFVLLPWGADLAMGNGLWLVTYFGGNTDTTFLNPEMQGGSRAKTFTEPKAGATMVVRLARLPETGGRFCSSIRSVLDRAWDVLALLARADQIAALVRANGLTASREEWTTAQFEQEYGFRRQFIELRPDSVRAELSAAGC